MSTLIHEVNCFYRSRNPYLPFLSLCGLRSVQMAAVKTDAELTLVQICSCISSLSLLVLRYKLTGLLQSGRHSFLQIFLPRFLRRGRILSFRFLHDERVVRRKKGRQCLCPLFAQVKSRTSLFGRQRLIAASGLGILLARRG